MPKYTVIFQPDDGIGPIELLATDFRSARSEAHEIARRYPDVKLGAVVDERGSGGLVLVNRTSFPFLATVPPAKISD